MPDNRKSPAPTAAPTPAAGRKPTLKIALILAGVLALEAVVIVTGMSLFGGPDTAKGIGLEPDPEAVAAAKLVEIPVAKDRYPNLNSGRQNLYDTEVFVTVPGLHAERITADLKAMNAQLSMDIASIFRSAHPSFFQEPTLATLRRQIHAALDERFGLQESGESYLADVIITKCTPIRAGF